MDNPTGTLLSTLPETVSQSQLARYVILASLMVSDVGCVPFKSLNTVRCVDMCLGLAPGTI